MKLTSLKLPKKSREDEGKTVAAMPDPEPYPWGTRVTLEKEALAKIKACEGLQVGDVVTIEARAVVTAREESAAEGRDARKSLTLQITEIGIESMDDDDAGYREGAKDA